MATKEPKNVADYIFPLNMNGLKGRMLRMPAPTGKKREILFIYGHHSSIERWWGVIQDLGNEGADLKGEEMIEFARSIGSQAAILYLMVRSHQEYASKH
jgi:hypothetical protein